LADPRNEDGERCADIDTFVGHEAGNLMNRLRDFPASNDVPLVMKASLKPARLLHSSRLWMELDPQASVQAHAGSGIVIARFCTIRGTATSSRLLIGRLQPAARASGGNIVVLSSSGLGELTAPSSVGRRGRGDVCG
jgi:hypothetical protein